MLLYEYNAILFVKYNPYFKRISWNQTKFCNRNFVAEEVVHDIKYDT